ncbi:hypothetical protein TWF192_001769 [Orbilia oligospora]|uniref:Kelch repeat protein n=1 Tax=Orbilia oligospora TaxID=2813651 RepID=A0A6G1MHB8_ORBOL|nr:hypothetical protein TWF191_002134 [Orbilia oligospora]KAF3256342.1 hypothetical protein TWF192_001769 [Orbilia oligospora]
MVSIRGTWTKIAESDRLKRSSQSLAVVGQQVYIYGGEVTARVPVDGALELINFNGSTVTTSTLPNISPAPTPRVGGATAVLDGVLYLFSGRGGLAMTSIEENGGIWKYTSSTGWEFILPKYPSISFPLGRSYHAATASQAEGLIYIHAGCPESGRLSDLWSYNPKENVWIKLPDAPEGKQYLFTMFGEGRPSPLGHAGAGRMWDDAWIFDIEEKSWQKVEWETIGPAPRGWFAADVIEVEGKDGVVLHGGLGEDNERLGDVWLLKFN